MITMTRLGVLKIYWVSYEHFRVLEIGKRL